MHDSHSYTNSTTISHHKPVIKKINFTLNFDRKIQRPKKTINVNPNTKSKYKILPRDKIEQTMRLKLTNQEI